MTLLIMQFIRQILRFWKTALVLTGILILCLIPSENLSKIDPFKFSYEDLIIHMIMFIVFSALLFHDLQKNVQQLQDKASLSLFTFFLSILLGITTEMLQFVFVSLNRSASFTDFIFDIIGILAGITLMNLIRQ